MSDAVEVAHSHIKRATLCCLADEPCPVVDELRTVQQAERAAIVKWLRAEATNFRYGDEGTYNTIADAIMRGEHLR